MSTNVQWNLQVNKCNLSGQILAWFNWSIDV